MSDSTQSTASSRPAKTCTPVKKITRAATVPRKTVLAKKMVPKNPHKSKKTPETKPQYQTANLPGEDSEYLTSEGKGTLSLISPVSRGSVSSSGPTEFGSATGTPILDPLEHGVISPRKRRGSEGDSSPSTPDHKQESGQPMERPRSESSVLRIKAQLRAAAEASMEYSVRMAEEPDDEERGNESVISDISAIGGGALHEMPRLANALLQRTKGKLEESRNMSREIREVVCSGIHGLYEMVLRLADSRNRHIAEKERQKATNERRMAYLQAKHAAALESMLKSHMETQQKILDEVKATHKEAEAVRWIAYEVESNNKELSKNIGLATAETLCPVTGQELRTVQEDIATLRLELGTLNMNLESAKAHRDKDPIPSQVIHSIREDIAGLKQMHHTSDYKRDDARHAELRHGNVQGVDTLSGSRKTYASVLNSPKHGVLVESLEPQHTSDDVLKLVRDSVDVIKMGIGVNKVTKISRQRVVINCDSERERDELQKALKEKNPRVTVSQTRPKKPLLRLIGVLAELSNPQIEEAIFKQNKSQLEDIPESEKQVRVVRRAKGRTNLLTNVVIETSSVLWKRLQEHKLRIGYQVVNVVDQSPIMQCFNCLGFGHRASDCKGDTKCGHCAGEHDTRRCGVRDAPARCCNCSNKKYNDTAHPAYSSSCPEFIRWDRLARASVAYC